MHAGTCSRSACLILLADELVRRFDGLVTTGDPTASLATSGVGGSLGRGGDGWGVEDMKKEAYADDIMYMFAVGERAAYL